MNYIFFGTPRFAAIILEKLIKVGLTPKAVVCSPDKPFGRKQIITPPPVKVLLNELGKNIEILQPAKIDEEFLNKLKNISADFYIVAAYAKILPESLIKIPKLGVIGVHPSLLPKFRGASPIQSAILSGDEETGVSLFIIDKKIDNGPILSLWKVKIGEDNYEELEAKLAEVSGDLLVATLSEFSKGEMKATHQDDSKATFTKKFTIEDGFIAPERLEIAQNGLPEASLEVERIIRALNPEPGVWTEKEGKRTKLLEAKIVDNKLKLVRIQEAGKKPVTIL